MTLIKYEDKRFGQASLDIIDTANNIIAEYQAQGFMLTLRQLYYQFVARDLLPNTMQSYKRLGSIINDARLAGLVSWTAIEDRTRNLRKVSTWESPREILDACASQFKLDRRENQPFRLEVWIEKDALVGVIADVCDKYQVPYFACRGYNSQSEQWAAGQRFRRYILDGQKVQVLHLGDHDPSGIDMTRDNSDRLGMFAEDFVFVNRLALNHDQVRLYNPPPNPAKLTDSRASQYVERFGSDSWELDALEPKVIVGLVESNIEQLIDWERWDEVTEEEDEGKEKLRKAAEEL